MENQETNNNLNNPDLASQGAPLRSYRKTNIFRNKLFLGFVGISFIVAFLIGGFILGRNSVLKELNPIAPVIPPRQIQ